MAETPIIEGTCEELMTQLQAFPREQRFRLTPLSSAQEPPMPLENDESTEETSLAEQFAGRAGRFHFGNANLSQSSSEKFAALMAAKKREGRL